MLMGAYRNVMLYDIEFGNAIRQFFSVAELCELLGALKNANNGIKRCRGYCSWAC